jgi:hypothetical protein
MVPEACKIVLLTGKIWQENLKDLKDGAITGGPECDPKGSMAFLQNQFRCPFVLRARRN